MIARHWTGLVKKGREDEYITHLKNETFKRLNQIEGFVNASILKRQLTEATEFLIVTKWDSLEAIRKFAGEKYEDAVVPKIAQELMISYDLYAKHYQVDFETK